MIPGVTGGGTLVEFDLTALGSGTSDLAILNNADLILQDWRNHHRSAKTGGSMVLTGPDRKITSEPWPSKQMYSRLFASLALLAPICPELVRETPEIPSEGTNLAAHG